MLRREKEITDIKKISEIISKCTVCRLALAKDNKPYIVPVSFGYDNRMIYIHTTNRGGMKLDYLRANNSVCFEFEHGVKVIPDPDKPCRWSFSFQSVIGFGKIQRLDSTRDKTAGLKVIMNQYSDQQWDFSGIPVDNVEVWKITIEQISGKQSLDFKN